MVIIQPLLTLRSRPRLGDAFHDHRARLPALRQRSDPQDWPRRERGPARKCLECGRTFVLQPKGARYDEKFKDQVVAAYQDRMSIRGITRTFGVCYETVMRWVGEKSGKSSSLRGHALAC